MITSWIPNAFGRVSFSQIGSPNGSDKRAAANFSDGRFRYVIVRECRHTRDSILSQFRLYWLDRKVNGQSNKFNFVLLARSQHEAFSRQNELRGSIFINDLFQENYSSIEDAVRGRWSTFHNSEEHAKQANDWEQAFDQIQQNVHDIEFVELKSTLTEKSYLSIDFTLDRHGRVDFKIATHNIDRNLQNSEENIKNSIIKGVFHAYLFLKDISHQHTHHSPRSDSILDVYLTYRFEELELLCIAEGQRYRLQPKAEAQINDVNWREEVLYSLHRKASSLQMKSDSENLSIARGIIKYASVFSALFGLSDGKIKNIENARFSEDQICSYE